MNLTIVAIVKSRKYLLAKILGELKFWDDMVDNKDYYTYSDFYFKMKSR